MKDSVQAVCDKSAHISVAFAIAVWNVDGTPIGTGHIKKWEKYLRQCHFVPKFDIDYSRIEYGPVLRSLPASAMIRPKSLHRTSTGQKGKNF